MAASQPGSRRISAVSNSNTEPFPSMPESPAGPSSNNDNTTTTTTTTTVHGPTITTTIHRGRPYTITSTQPTNQTPASIVSAPDNSVTTTSAGPATTRTTLLTPSQANRTRPISIRRLPSTNLRAGCEENGSSLPPSRSASGRGRSTSAPQPPHLTVPGSNNLTRQSTRQSMLPTVAENPQAAGDAIVDRETMNENVTGGVSRRRSVSNTARSIMSRFSDTSRERQGPEYESEVVDLLDVLDPEVSTLTTLNNVQNSLFVPDLGRWVNRRPTYNLSRRTTQTRRPEPVKEETGMAPIQRQATGTEEPAPEPLEEDVAPPETMQRTWSWQRRPQIERSHSITSVVTDSHYAVLPHGVSLEGWSEEDKEALDDHVRHMLHSKRSKFKQRMIAFGKYIQKPLGFFVFLYATLITLFGLAWVLFLIGWIYVGDRKDYITNVIDNVLVALFAIMGDGLAPFRMVDTYHMIFIAHYHHKSWRLRRERALPKLHDHNDLPAQREKEADPESGKPEDSEFSVLNPKQQQKLIHHQAKFSKSHSFYKPHETGTHYAFPLHLLVAIVVLLDCHSLFQIALGTCTWAIDYHTRPQALTATILSCSITCNITAGILITVGDRKTRKKDVALRMQRQELTQTAIEKVEKHKREREQQAEEQAHLTDAPRNFEVIDEETTTDSNFPSQVNSRTH
ncbi:integral membrane protein [Cladophialophora carrionii]|uniref:Integral membrane protein n=1 Tax=Cladophialophora carrionii TaxID=86049 RepID=A0A1C1CB87_9EURO|nr:integral membrane protein [Cladophialophora carrionii]